MVRIRLKRVGAKKHPTYRIVVADQRAARDGAFIEQIGTYDPHPDPPEIRIDEEKVASWMKNGAQPSDSVISLLRTKGIFPKIGAAAVAEEAPKTAAKAAPKAAPKAAATATAVAEAPAEVAEEAPAEDAKVATAEVTDEAPAEAAEEAPAEDAAEDEAKETPGE
jgi:small subunit ribosomal protein S16